MALSFRSARKLWVGLIALLSLTCIFLALVLWLHGYSKLGNFGAVIAIPAFAFTGAIWTYVARSTLLVISLVDIILKKRICKKRFFSPQIVCVEATWVFVLLPFQMLLGFFASESDDALRSRFTIVYGALVVLVWTNSALVFLYTTGIISLAVLTQLSCDQEIWARDIDSSPCPFPFAVLLVYVFPFADKYLRGTAVQCREGVNTTTHCLPGCPCRSKPTEVPRAEADYIQDAQPAIPIRIPTAMEMQHVIRITLSHHDEAG